MSPVAGAEGNVETRDISVKTSPEQDWQRVKYFPQTVVFCLPRDRDHVLRLSLSRQPDSRLPRPALCRHRHTKDCAPERPCPLHVPTFHLHMTGLSPELFARVTVTKILSSEPFCVRGLREEGRVSRTEAPLES